MSIDRWKDKEDEMHIYDGLLSHKKGWNNAVCSTMDGPRDYHIEWSKSDKQRKISYITHMWNLKYDTNEPIYKTEINTSLENRLVIAKGEGKDGGSMNWEFELSRRKLLHREWINNKVLLHSTGNYIQYPVINHNGKKYFKRMYAYV